MASAGTVTVDFAAETAKFTAELKKVQGSLSKMEGNFKSMERVAGVALRVFSGAALSSFTKQAFAAADAAATAAERAGIAVETFSRLQFAAGQTDVEMNALTSGIQRYQVTLEKANEGNRQAAATFARFNLQASELAKLSIENQLGAIADAFQAVNDPAARTRLAVDLFGESAGPQLVPLLSQGRKGIADLTDQADRLGITLTGSTAKGIDEADKAIKRLTGTLSAYTAKFVAGLSITILGPPEEVLKIDDAIAKLEARRDALLNGSGFKRGEFLDPVGVRESVNAINAQIDVLMKKQADLLGLGPSKPGAGGGLVASIIGDIQEIDLEAIRSMKIEVDELQVAYAELDESVRKSREAVMQQIVADGADEQMAFESQLTEHIMGELERRSQAASYYRDQEYQQEQLVQTQMVQLRQAALDSTLGALQSFAGGSKKAAIALVAVNKGLAIAKAVQDGYVAVQNALAYVPYPYNLAASAQMKMMTAINVAGIAASAYGQIQSINRAGGAPIGHPANPAHVTAQREGAPDFGAESQNVVQIIVQGNVVGNREFIEEMISEISDAVNERDVIVIQPTSRNAIELAGAGA